MRLQIIDDVRGIDDNFAIINQHRNVFLFGDSDQFAFIVTGYLNFLVI
jgi:hypothetical protein